jgi:YbbR domain-containing protein
MASKIFSTDSEGGKMFNNKIVNIIFSILVAIGLWVYVVGEINPETTGKYADVPVRFINAEVLADDGLALVDPGVQTVSVTISGTRADMKELRVSEIDVTADLSDLVEGENQVELAVSLPNDMKVQSISNKRVKVTIEELVTAEKPIQIKYEGTIPEGKEPGAITITPASIQVSGAASAVAKVQHIAATIPVSDIKNTPSDLSATLKPEDKDGALLSYLFLSQGKANVRITLLDTKTVPLRLDVIGSVPDGYVLESKSQPETITIKGTAEALSDISVIFGEDIDLSDQQESAALPIQLTLPEGVEVANASLNPALELVISPVAVKTFTYDLGSLAINGLATGLTVDLPTQSILLTIQSSAEISSGLVSGDFALSLDLEGLKAGTHKVAILVETPKTGLVYKASPKEIQVVIREE